MTRRDVAAVQRLTTKLLQRWLGLMGPLEASPGLADTEHEVARAVSWKDVLMPRPRPPKFRERAVELARLREKPVRASRRF